MSRPRVGIDARLCHATGIGRYVRGLVNALAAEARDLDLVIIVNPKNDPTAVWDWLDNAAGEARDEGRLEVAQFGKTVPPYSIAEQFWIAEAARSKKLDLLHSPHWNVSLLNQVPLVTTLHDAIYLRVAGAAPSRAARFAAGFFLKRAARRSVRVIVPSKAAGEEVAAATGIAPEKIAPVALTADDMASWVERVRRGSCETISPRVRELPRFVLYVGTQLPHKQVPLLVRAFATVKKELGLRELVLALAGPRGRDTPFIEDAIKATGMAESVVFLGEVTDRDLGYLYDRAACYATASAAEGFGLSPLEALAAGAPVIATDLPAHREVLGDAALLVAPGDEKALANALARVLGVEACARDLSRRGPPRAACFPVAALARGTANVYREALRISPLPALALERKA